MGFEIWILDGDIAKAYDNTRHSEVLTSILEAGCPKVLAAAWAREFSSMGVRMKLGQELTDCIPRTKALFQGDPSAPFLFNRTLDRPLYAFHCLAQKMKWGIPIHFELWRWHLLLCYYCVCGQLLDYCYFSFGAQINACQMDVLT